MKKTISLLIASVLTVGAAVSSYAAVAPAIAEKKETLAQQTVLEKIKDRVGNTDEYENFYSDVYGGGVENVYAFDWSTEGDERKTLSVTATDDGIITNYYKYQYEEYLQEESGVSARAEMMAKAENLLEELNPDLDLVIKNGNYGKGNMFSVQRVENGVPVYNQQGYVTLNSDGSEITEFYVDYTGDYKIESVSKTISKDEAEKFFAEKIGLELVYRKDYGKDNVEIYMAYAPKETGVYINALDGSKFSPTYYRYNFATEAAASPAMTADGAAEEEKLSVAEMKEFEKISGLMTGEELFEILKTKDVLEMPKESSMSYYDFYHKGDDEYNVSITFSTNNGNGSATMNAKTGDIVSYNYYVSGEGKEMSESTGTAKAVKVLKALGGEKAEEFEKATFNSDKWGAAVGFTRYHGGIECEFDGARVGFNADGTVRNYYLNYTDARFPSRANAITKEVALGNIFDGASYELVYMSDSDKQKFVPVYMFKAYDVSINAITGEFVNDVKDFEDISFEEYYTDIANSPAKEEIIKLAEYGIYFADDAFRPTENIKQKDIIAILHNVFGYETGAIGEDTYETVYRYAKRNGVIKKGEENRNAAVTKMDAAKFIVRYLGYEDVAELDIYAPEFSDLKENKGYASILGGMGIMSGDENGNFSPDEVVKREDIAEIAVNIIER
ncbi:MAG: S-layer homology domain-containing protein [Firmicutes bacterium]|nr:S-layer homology domain-containing protein [Bacillota bacterium]